MRVFALSDIHIDYNANAKWIESLSVAEYKDDVLILAGDVTDIRSCLIGASTFSQSASRKFCLFREITNYG